MKTSDPKFEIQLGKRKVGSKHPPYVVAEMSGNHNQSLERALQIVDAAAASGAHAVKIQTYTADTMTIDCAAEGFVIQDKNSPWFGRKLYELYQEAATPWEWHSAIFNRCADHGLDFFSTPFDESAVDFLETLQVPFYKIASFECTDIALIRKVALTGKPVVISTGMASEEEIAEAVTTMRKAGNTKIILLKCTSSYPASPTSSHINTIPVLAQKFNCLSGLSDHTLGFGVSVAAIGLGACFIEKHFTLNRSEGGVDSIFSMEPGELKMLVTEVEKAWQALGEIHFGPTQQEKPSLQFRRSLYVVKDLKAGEILTSENVRAIRPGFGLAPKFIDEVLGKKVLADVKKGTPLAFKLIG